MSSEVNEIFSLAMAIYKDHIMQEELEKFKEEFIALQQAESEMRRKKADTLIRQKAALNNELAKFKISYNCLIEKTGTRIRELDKYIADIENQIKRISFEKNNLRKKKI